MNHEPKSLLSPSLYLRKLDIFQRSQTADLKDHNVYGLSMNFSGLIAALESDIH